MVRDSAWKRNERASLSHHYFDIHTLHASPRSLLAEKIRFLKTRRLNHCFLLFIAMQIFMRKIIAPRISNF